MKLHTFQFLFTLEETKITFIAGREKYFFMFNMNWFAYIFFQTFFFTYYSAILFSFVEIIIHCSRTNSHWNSVIMMVITRV